MGAVQQLLVHIRTMQVTSPPVLYAVASLAAVFALLRLWRSRRKAHNLPVVRVTGNNVVETLEDAHKKVR